MADDRPGDSGYLPPEPPGPEPDIGARQPPQPPPPPPQQQPWQQQPQPPGWQPPQWGQPPPPWGQPPQPAEPDNGAAVAGFVLSISAAGLMVISLLLLAFVSVICSILGIVYSRRGKRRVEAGETRKHKGLAQAGFITGIVTLVLAVPVTLLEIVFLIAYATDEEFREDFNDEFDEELDSSDSFSLVLRLAVPVLKAGARLLL